MKRGLAILAIAATLRAADFHCGASATGNGSGSDWNNQADFDTLSLTRGNTYYLADGTYAGKTFNTANSGTTRIIIQKATESSHGSATGWSSGLGDGQAVFGALVFNTGYYTLDGVTGGGPSGWQTGFGIKINGDISTPQFVDNNIDQVLLRHFDLDGGATGPGEGRGMTLYAMNGLTIEYAYIHDVGCDMISMNAMNDFTLQYSKLARNHQAEPGCHGDLIEYQIDNASNFIVRYNFFEDIVGSYAFGSHDPTITGYEIYGNIFYFPNATFFGNGLVGCLGSGGTINNLKFYNNTISGNCDGLCGAGILRGTGNEMRNNIWHQTAGSFSAGFDNATQSGNTCYNTTCAGATNTTGDPFIGSGSGNFNLSVASAAGTSLSSPYNADMTGTTRGGDGNWDRGALEYGGAASSPPGMRVSGAIVSGAVIR